MFKLFKKKTEVEKLTIEYQKLLAEAHKLSTISRSLSDRKIAEANEILEQIKQHENQMK
jgi:hypothetical protein